MRLSAVLAPLLLLACSRSFRAPLAQTPAPQLDHVEPSAAGSDGTFAGETLTLFGKNFSAAAEQDEVRIDGVQARVLTSPTPPSESSLTVRVPPLPASDAGRKVLLTLTVAGAQSNALQVVYRGLGHPDGFTLSPGASLAPTPVAVSVLAHLAMVSLLRNRVHALLPDVRRDQAVVFPAVARALPFASWQTLSFDGGGFGASDSPFGLAIWTSEFDFTPGVSDSVRQVLRSNAFTARSELKMPVVAVAPALAVSAEQDYRPVPGGLVNLSGSPLDAGFDSESRSAALTAGHGPESLIQSDSQLIFEVQPDGGASVETRVAALYGDGLGKSTLAVLVEQGGAPTDAGVDQFELDVAGESTSAFSLDPDGQKVWLLTRTGFGGNRLAARLPDGGLFGERAVTGAGLLVSTRGAVITGDVFSNRLNIYPQNAAAQVPFELALPGPPFAFTRDDSDPDRLFALVVTPPALVEIDPGVPTVVHQTPLQSGLRLLASSGDAHALAFTGDRIPALVTVDAQNLSPRGDFQHQTPPGEPDYGYTFSAAFRGVDGGPTELCVDSVRAVFDGGDSASSLLEGVRCGPPEAVFDSPDSCELVPERPYAYDSPVLASLPGGRLRVYRPSQASECGPCDAGCTPLTSFDPKDPLAMAATPSGGAVVAEATRVRIFAADAGGWTTVCANDSDCDGQQGVTATTIDLRERRVATLGHQTTVFTLGKPEETRRIRYLADVPLSLAFSPDGTRLVVGTLLGHLDEYDLDGPAALDPAADLSPSRSLFAGFPITQIIAPPEGDRLLLLDAQTDALWVVR